MSNIIGAEVRTFGDGHFASKNAVVITNEGEYKYWFSFEIPTWKNYGDYLDNAMSDFENENSTGDGITSSELFELIGGDK